MKKTLNERFQELAGIKPLYTEQDKDQYGRTQADRDWEKGINPKTDKKNTAQDSATITKVVNLKMSDINEPVTVEYKSGSNLTDVTISWGNESHTVDFTDDVEEIDDFGNEGMDLEAITSSDDGRWQFILDVYAEATYPMTGDFAEWDFEELIIQPHPDLDGDDDDDLRLEPEDGEYEDGTEFEDDDLRLDPELDEGSCGYTHTTQGKQLKTPGGTKGRDAYQRTKTMRS